jgi:hypothetical protein
MRNDAAADLVGDGHRRAARPAAVSDRRRRLVSPLWLLVALVSTLGLNVTSAAAGSATETRVGAIELVTVDSVAWIELHAARRIKGSSDGTSGTSAAAGVVHERG